MKPYLSVIIPAYDEEDNLRRGSLDVALEYLKKQKYSWEIIAVNDGSSDATLSLLQKYPIRIIDNPHQGKAATVITGALAAAGDIILFTDMDQATPISELDKFIPLFKFGTDIAIGSRSGRPNAPVFRKILAFGMIIMRTLILRLPFWDTQCGFKVFTKLAARKIFAVMNKVHVPGVVSGPAVNPGFDLEMLYLGRKLGYKITEVPVSWRHQETRRVSFVRDAIAGVTELFLVRWRALTNAYALRNHTQL